MKKSKLLEILLMIIGLHTYSIGYCMYMIDEWNLKNWGIGTSFVGFILIGLFIIAHIKNNMIIYKKQTKRDIIFRFIGLLGLLLFALGMVLMFATKYFTIGVVISASGLIIDLINYPLYNYQKTIISIKRNLTSKNTYKNIVSFIGAILFTIGLTLTIIERLNLVVLGTIIGIIGMIILIINFYVSGRNENKKEYYIIDYRNIFIGIIGIIGAYLIGIGLTKIVPLTTRFNLILGLYFEYFGYLLCALNIPIFIYLKKNHIYNKHFRVDIHDKKYSYSLKNLWLMFLIYGFLGWCVEFIVCGAYRGNFINRGFLHITLLPVWGLGGMVVTLIFSKSQRFVFTKSLVYLSLLEYVTSILLEYIFNNKWWDYTNNPFNLNGRICLFNCLAFGIFGFIFSKYISPLINAKLNKASDKKINYVVIITGLIFVADLLYSLFFPNTGIGITS